MKRVLFHLVQRLDTGRVYYTDVLNETPEEIKKSIEEMKIQDTNEESLFSKTIIVIKFWEYFSDSLAATKFLYIDFCGFY